MIIFILVLIALAVLTFGTSAVWAHNRRARTETARRRAAFEKEKEDLPRREAALEKSCEQLSRQLAGMIPNYMNMFYSMETILKERAERDALEIKAQRDMHMQHALEQLAHDGNLTQTQLTQMAEALSRTPVSAGSNGKSIAQQYQELAASAAARIKAAEAEWKERRQASLALSQELDALLYGQRQQIIANSYEVRSIGPDENGDMILKTEFVPRDGVPTNQEALMLVHDLTQIDGSVNCPGAASRTPGPTRKCCLLHMTVDELANATSYNSMPIKDAMALWERTVEFIHYLRQFVVWCVTEQNKNRFIDDPGRPEQFHGVYYLAVEGFKSLHAAVITCQHALDAVVAQADAGPTEMQAICSVVLHAHSVMKHMPYLENHQKWFDTVGNPTMRQWFTMDRTNTPVGTRAREYLYDRGTDWLA